MFKGGTLPRKTPTPFPRKFATGCNFLKKSYFAVRIEEETLCASQMRFLGAKLAKTAHMLLDLRPRLLGKAAYSAPHIPSPD